MSLLKYSSAAELIGLTDDIREKLDPIFRENEQICHKISELLLLAYPISNKRKVFAHICNCFHCSLNLLK